MDTALTLLAAVFVYIAAAVGLFAVSYGIMKLDEWLAAIIRIVRRELDAMRQ